MSRRYENRAKVCGILNDKNYNTDISTPLGRLTFMANNNRIDVNLWEKKDQEGNSLGTVDNYIKQLSLGAKYEIKGFGVALDERLWDGEYRRNVTNRRITQNEVYNIAKVSEEHDEYSRVKLSGDVLESKLELTDKVRGEDVNTETPKLKATIVVFDTYNRESGENDLTAKEVLKQEIKRVGQNQDKGEDEKVYKGMLSRLENNEDNLNVYYDVLEEFLEKADRVYNINTFHVCAYENLGENIYDMIKKGDNITIGCDVNTKMITDEYDVVKGNLNEVEIRSFGGVNEEGLLATKSDVEGDADDLDW